MTSKYAKTPITLDMHNLCNLDHDYSQYSTMELMGLRDQTIIELSAADACSSEYQGQLKHVRLMVLDELAKRPHIPNKLERKEIRKQKAQAK